MSGWYSEGSSAEIRNRELGVVRGVTLGPKHF